VVKTSRYEYGSGTAGERIEEQGCSTGHPFLGLFEWHWAAVDSNEHTRIDLGESRAGVKKHSASKYTCLWDA